MVNKLHIAKRLQADGRWGEVEPVKNRMIKEARQQGMDKESAQAWAYSEVDRLYPPLPPAPGPDVRTAETSGRVQGLGDLPADWPELPANASLQAEIGWVQANRLVVVEEVNANTTRVHLDRAHEPAPSRAALGWLETSIRSYAKYVDVVARSLQTVADEQEHVRRERMQIEEIRSILDQMNEQIAADMRANASATVRERVRSVVPDWCRRCGIDESHQQWLEGHVCQLAMDLLTAAGGSVGTDENGLETGHRR